MFLNKALEICDFVETDVRITKDKELILFHDPTINNQKIEDELLLVPSIEDGLNGVKFISAVVESGLGGSKWLKF